MNITKTTAILAHFALSQTHTINRQSRSAIVAGTAVFLTLLLANAAWGGTRLGIGTTRGFPAVTVSVPISLRGETNVTAFQADVLFDEGLVTSVDPVPGALAIGRALASSRPSAGVRRILIYSPDNRPLSNGVTADLPFAVAPDARSGIASLVLANVLLVKADATTVAVTNGNGFIGLSPVFVHPDGHADGFLTVTSNALEQCYVIQASTDLKSWIGLSTNNAVGSLLEFTDPGAASYPYRFYRAVLCNSVSGERVGIIDQLPNGQIRFDFAGTAGRTYVIQASTNLTQWADLATNSAPISFSTPIAPGVPYRFFRVREAP